MTQQEFQKLFDERVAKLIETGKTKGVKYTVSAEDRLVNFKALLPRMTPFQVWEVFFSKHWSAIQYFLTTGKNTGEDICDTHIHDCIMYLFLLEGLVKETQIDISTQPRWCRGCSHGFINKNAYEQHLKSAHNTTDTVMVRCNRCKVDFNLSLFDTNVLHLCPNCHETSTVTYL